MDQVKYGKLVDFIHLLISQSYGGTEELYFVDATCGNGYDTLFLCKLAGPKGHVKAFDIQKLAIERTKTLLESKLDYTNYEIILDSHEFISKYINDKIDCAVFNLGYLPNSDKEIITRGDTTVAAISNLLPHLKNNGRIFIATYVAHDSGYEINEISNYLSSLDKSMYNVLHIKLINKENSPPELFIIEKNA
jgi:SAM-dependent methyltransferase